MERPAREPARAYGATTAKKWSTRRIFSFVVAAAAAAAVLAIYSGVGPSLRGCTDSEALGAPEGATKQPVGKPPALNTGEKWDPHPELSASRWIIVTSINEVTPAVKAFAALPGWQVLVVGDSITPADYAWEGVVFLSLETQTRLGYETVNHLPVGVYPRKNVGYVYAIAHGAELIYETDDDNAPTNEGDGVTVNPKMPSNGKAWPQLLPKKAEPTTSGRDPFHDPSSEFDWLAVNPYAYFETDHLWPRGFPLSKIVDYSDYKVEQDTSTGYPATVQSYLADLDPDVDALWRLTQGDRIGTIRFSREKEPVVLPRGVYCSHNAQNTIWYHESFWAMLLPITVTFRVTDIWRAYWGQRMMWDLGQRLMFAAPTVDQVRNPHSYLSDMREEEDLYRQTEDFLTFLNSWTSPSTDLPQRLKDLGRDMVAGGFLGPADEELMNAWVDDLTAVGYQWPEVLPAEVA